MGIWKNKATEFNGVTHIRKDNLANNLLYGVMDFLQWGFLQVGGFQNITRNPAVTDSFGTNDRYRLRYSSDPSYTAGQVWEGFRNDWVWESGITFQGINPIRVSGVWIDNSFYGPSDTTYSHYVDYPNGRVIFDTPVDSSKTVSAEFSHRTVGVARASESFIQELLYDSYDMESGHDYTLIGSGTRNQLGQRRLQLPVVGVEVVRSLPPSPYEIGGSEYVYNDVLFHIFADNEDERNDIRDIIVNQNRKVICLINRGSMKEDSNYPLQLDSLGSPKPSAIMYPYLLGVGGYKWKDVQFTNTVSTDMEPVNRWLHRATVRSTFTAIMSNI